MIEVYSPFGFYMKIPTTPALWSTPNMRKYRQSDVYIYIYQCEKSAIKKSLNFNPQSITLTLQQTTISNFAAFSK